MCGNLTILCFQILILECITDLSSCISHVVSVSNWWEFCKSSLQVEIIDYAKSKPKLLFRERVSLTNQIIRPKQYTV